MKFDVPCAICSQQITEKSQDATGGGGIITAAEMLNAQCFAFGISGVYKIHNYESLQLKTEDQICNECLRTLKFDPLTNVVCGVCREHFHAIWDLAGNIGWGCSSDVKDGVISCGFGSNFDECSFSTQLKNMETICDKCIGSNNIEKLVPLKSCRPHRPRIR